MRHILITSVLLALPVAAVAQEETQSTQSDPRTQQTQDQQSQAQQPQTRQTQGQEAQSTQQSGEMDDFGAESQSISAESQSQAGSQPEAARAQFTSEVQDREPVDEVSDEFQAAQAPLYFFTEIKNGAGETITHRWLHDGEVMAEVPLDVGSDSWRTWSSKELTPELAGDWTVEVVDSQGNVITEESISVEASGAQTGNVGFSPDEEDATQEPTSATQSQETQGGSGSMMQTQGQSQQGQGSSTQSQDSETDDTQEEEDPLSGDY